jgi:protein ImuB
VFGALYAAEGTDPAMLGSVAREFSPRIEVCGPREITLDLSGLERLFGEARMIAHELRRTAADRGLRVRVAIAGTRSAARLFVHDRAGITVIEPGCQAEMLASLPLGLLEVFAGSASMDPARRGTRPITNPKSPGLPQRLSGVAPTPNPKSQAGPESALLLTETLRRWGLRTLGEFAALPSDEVAARLGTAGVEWQRLARGEDPRPLVPALPEERFEQTLELDWPIEGLEPLSFVLGRLIEPLSAHLERRDRGAAVLHVRLHLVTRAVHERSLQLPAPMRDARALRTLALLDLESHPPDAAIDQVTVAVDPTPGRVVQFSLLTRPLPSPEQLSTLSARLAALMGEGRCGSPELVDSWRPGAFAMKPFAPRDSNVLHTHQPRPSTMLGASRAQVEGRRHEGTETKKIGFLRDSVSPWPVPVNAAASPTVALRRFRTPIPVRVHAEDGRPIRVWMDRRGLSGGRIEIAAGPWRTSGSWWESQAWNRDEWDVALADGVTYRLFRERLSVDARSAEPGLPSRSPKGEGWFIEGIVD